MTLRIPELYNLLKSLKKDNPLPDLTLKTKATILDEDMAAINPSYYTNDIAHYDENCGACTIAYDLRRRGYDVAAVDEDTYHKSGGTVTDLLNCYDDPTLITQSDIAKNIISVKRVYPNILLKNWCRAWKKKCLAEARALEVILLQNGL